ncbi:ComEC/Rec2 family competence protein [[Clostridium] fimetarium]|uniref:Metal-dependent hydrolase, beta-lactamase superfamily II n=1 Tax=[Clostridium] fimetarium TaxID=99656 RepID=A0A1I0QV09_9FIRM|nr:hypothetical protein [[Clostridium] fimetarium]SEW31503.1 hypothetical protein SAMN05421659_109154 [[Clostridium] fimetarium]
MRNRKFTFLDEIQDLYISIYLIGYEVEGESCIFILHTKVPEKKILYSIVIDCYENTESNCTIDILEKLELKNKLDMLIWTHPHDDHTIGLNKIIKRYCDKNTKIITSNILNHPNGYSDICIELANQINSKCYNKSKNRWNVNSAANLGYGLQTIEFTNASGLINNMKIKCISPVSEIGLVQGLNKKVDLNKISIGIIIQIERNENRLNFMFTGDMDKQTIAAIVNEQEDEEIPFVYNLIKLPHHGSTYSSNLVNLLRKESRSELAVTTVFKKDSLPTKDAIDIYKDYFEDIRCTSSPFDRLWGTGMIKVEYDIGLEKSEVNTYGTANKIC